jgi:hypothetical protein
MGIEPPCCDDCERQPYRVLTTVNVASKSRCGRANGSQVAEVGLGGTVALAKLDGNPIAGSEYDGFFKTVTVEAHYPVSVYDPGDPPAIPAKWVRDRSVIKKWSRKHDGNGVIDCQQSPTFRDEYSQVGFPIEIGEEIRPGSDEDPENFGPDFLDLDASKVETGSKISKQSLLEYANNLPREWETYNAPPEFDIYGICAGIIFDTGYEDDGNPYSASRLEVKWTIGAANPEPGIAAGPPPMLEDDAQLFSSVKILGVNLADEEPQIEELETKREQLPWRPEINRFSKASDLTFDAVDSDQGWERLNTSTQPGVLRILEPYEYDFDVGPMFFI